MCGICGIINLNDKHVEPFQLQQMMQAMKHRGPDDEGVYISKNLGLGFVRLSIIDLTYAGHQPMISNDKRYIITFNGEIYNYIELKEELRYKYTFKTNTDTEVLLASFINWKENCLDHLNGMFAFTIYDKLENKLFAARDRYGIKPFYYYLDVSRFVFASEIPPILKVLHGKPSPNYQMIFDYLVFNRTDHTEETFFSKVKKLQHGHYFWFDLNKSQKEMSPVRWYKIENKLTSPFINETEYKELFTSAVKIRLRSDVPVGVCLSGGLDSSSIVSVISHSLGQQEIKTFSAVYEKGKKGDESDFIKEYADILKYQHFIYPSAKSLFEDKEKFVMAHGEPVPSTGPYAHFKVMELAKEHVVVTLDGQGADEGLAGYHYFFGFYFKELLYNFRLIKLANEIFHYLNHHKSAYGIKSWLYSMFPSKSKSALRVFEKGYLSRDFISAYLAGNKIADSLYNANTLNESLINHFEYKLEHLLKWEDRNSMWFSLESRVPFLDYRLVEKTLSLPSKDVIYKGMTKAILRKSMTGLVPEKIVNRKDKLGFGTPQDEWFREKQFQNYIQSIINSREFISLKIIEPKKSFDLFNKHIQRKINVSNEIWKWINLHLWFQLFINNIHQDFTK